MIKHIVTLTLKTLTADNLLLDVLASTVRWLISSESGDQMKMVTNSF